MKKTLPILSKVASQQWTWDQHAFRPTECCNCHYATPSHDRNPWKYERPNGADPGEGEYDCSLLRLEAVWGEQPKCTAEQWRKEFLRELQGAKLLVRVNEVQEQYELAIEAFPERSPLTVKPSYESAERSRLVARCDEFARVCSEPHWSKEDSVAQQMLRALSEEGWFGRLQELTHPNPEEATIELHREEVLREATEAGVPQERLRIELVVGLWEVKARSVSGLFRWGDDQTIRSYCVTDDPQVLLLWLARHSTEGV